MIYRDELIEVTTERVPDGFGGHKTEQKNQKTIICKASLNTSPQVMSAYGLSGEQILYLTCPEELSKEALYLYKDKKYTLRSQTNNLRFFSCVLIEVKQ
jgi:hypothetical protein